MATATESGVPVLSFPAILRNPGISNRFAHLQDVHGSGQQSKAQQTAASKKQRTEAEGKRWIRRKDNDRFVGNPHVVAATRKDYAIPLTKVTPTFPEPLPAFLPRTVKLPTAPTLPETDPASANAGRFSLSLKGMRRELRRAGGRAEGLVRDVEAEMVQWLATGGTLLDPNTSNAPPANLDPASTPGTPVGDTMTITELYRTPLQLIWSIADDPFARYVVHCCARYHEVISYSKGAGNSRLTYLLRPNVTRPDRRRPEGLETPPVTDIDYSSNPDTEIESEYVSEHELDSDSDVDMEARTSHKPVTNAPRLSTVQEDSWSIIDEAEGADEEFESGSEYGSVLGESMGALGPRMEGLSIAEQPEEGAGDTTVVEEGIAGLRITAQETPRRRNWVSARSASSPSRSPARRRMPRRRRGAKKTHVVGAGSGQSFYEYLFC